MKQKICTYIFAILAITILPVVGQEQLGGFVFYVQPNKKPSETSKKTLENYLYRREGREVNWIKFEKVLKSAVAESNEKPLQISVIFTDSCKFELISHLHGVFGLIGGIQARYFVAEPPTAREVFPLSKVRFSIPDGLVPENVPQKNSNQNGAK
jgi:hypothetical protein